MLVMDYKDGAWQQPEIVPFESFSLHPATSAIHYGQSIFEGMKANRSESGDIADSDVKVEVLLVFVLFSSQRIPFISKCIDEFLVFFIIFLLFIKFCLYLFINIYFITDLL